MQTLLQCIKNTFQRRKPSYQNEEILLLQSFGNIEYRTSEVYCGKEGTCTFTENGFSIYLYYSERDGIGWKFKQVKPYRILFDYNDGAYFVNDPREYDYSSLIHHLKSLQDNAHNQNYEQTFQQLEGIMVQFAREYFDGQHN